MTVADSALYAAKRDGRNVVRLGPHRLAALPAELAHAPDSPQATG
jgi:hypothetical protein